MTVPRAFAGQAFSLGELATWIREGAGNLSCQLSETNEDQTVCKCRRKSLPIGDCQLPIGLWPTRSVSDVGGPLVGGSALRRRGVAVSGRPLIA